jgi:hypothetical protein
MLNSTGSDKAGSSLVIFAPSAPFEEDTGMIISFCSLVAVYNPNRWGRLSSS